MLRHQAGVITHSQALGAGISRHAIYARLESERWQRLHRGVYVGYSGPLTRESLMWAAVLAAGPGALLCYRTAAELHGLLDAPKGNAIHVMVPRWGTLRPMRRVVVHYSRRVDAAGHPALEPPRTRLEETVLDLAEAERTANGATAWILDACARIQAVAPLAVRSASARSRTVSSSRVRGGSSAGWRAASTRRE